MLQRMKNKIKLLRIERQMSQQDLADALNVSRQTINAIEQGKYSPSLPLAFALAQKFEQPIESIFQTD